MSSVIRRKILVTAFLAPFVVCVVGTVIERLFWARYTSPPLGVGLAGLFLTLSLVVYALEVVGSDRSTTRKVLWLLALLVFQSAAQGLYLFDAWTARESTKTGMKP